MALYRFLPDNVSPPVAWGRNSIGPESYSYLCDFITMKEKRPSSQEWASIVASLHRNSMGKSQGGQVGFHVATHLSFVPVRNAWKNSWEAFWTQQM